MGAGVSPAFFGPANEAGETPALHVRDGNTVWTLREWRFRSGMAREWCARDELGVTQMDGRAAGSKADRNQDRE